MEPELIRRGGPASPTDNDMRRRRRTHDVHRIACGVYTPLDPDGLDPLRRHRLAVDAMLPRLSPDAVVSHQSAAVVHGLTLWRTDLSRVHVTRERDGGGRRRAGLRVHPGDLRGRTTRVDGIVVTTLERTVVDLARELPFEQALVAADAALSTAGARRAELERACLEVTGCYGAPAARRVTEYASEGSESVGESRSRVVFAKFGVPLPIQQAELVTAEGRVRVDFLWRGHGVVGEFDGKVKYGRFVRPGEDAGDAVFREKRREDAIRDLGLRVVRWTWDDLDAPADLVARIMRTLGRR
ncbi:hypothetical protein DW322_07095 [Rhodococcus rhodnii]|uniref:DUF559 domain-containing protein n=3 Tax=Rhodococcus rhodnii TaxID=38312 RepID=R7WRY3_9NOCA|nr:hypothetical protein [Rhodococcus rhodnii]EOM76714.1 hypothetical protein Rrhod_1939 [Rhodococcus rhodnii LMG 5362]TXG90021.1 hypothetical protein DW322_07095 [Rhodococcus rhodnii]